MKVLHYIQPHYLPKRQEVTFLAVLQQVSSWRGRGRALARYWLSPGQRWPGGRGRCCWRSGQGRGYEEKRSEKCGLFQHVSIGGGALSADLPGQRDDGRSEAAAGYDWLLLGNGRGYSWRELSLDHASWRQKLENKTTHLWVITVICVYFYMCRWCLVPTLVPFDLWAESGETVGVRWRSGGGAFSCLSETWTFSLSRYKTCRPDRREKLNSLIRFIFKWKTDETSK